MRLANERQCENGLDTGGAPVAMSCQDALLLEVFAAPGGSEMVSHIDVPATIADHLHSICRRTIVMSIADAKDMLLVDMLTLALHAWIKALQAGKAV